MIRKLKVWALFASWLLLAPASGAAAKCTLKYEPLPITLDGDKPMVDATVNGHKVRFVLDSGSFFSWITPGTAATIGLKLHPLPIGLTVEGLGGEVDASMVAVENFEVAGASFHRLEFITGGSETGEGTAGVIGQNFLVVDDVEYDLANGIVRIVRPEGCKGDLGYWPSKSGYSGIDLVTFGNGKWATTAYVEVNGQKFKAEFDTGAGDSFLTLAAARRLGFNPKAPGVEEAETEYGFGPKPFRTWIMPVDSFKIGAEEVKHTRLRVGDSSIPDIDMLIGPDFFLSHHIYVANARKRIVFSYNGGPVFDLPVSKGAPASAQTASAAPEQPAGKGAFAVEPTDADGYARRGAAFTERKDYARAIADLTRAHELAPESAGYLYLRAVAYTQNGQPFLAVADLDASLELAPDNVDARITRASMRLAKSDPFGAIFDADAADKLLPTQADQRLDLAQLYGQAQAYSAASRQFDLWTKAHPDDARMGMALNGRCWMGAMSGADLDAALAACDGALRRAPKTADFLDSRGLVHLRRGETEKAIADYNAALSLDPKIAWSLYGRGVAEERKGKADAAKADFSAAEAITPQIAEMAHSIGLKS
ncbi:MAG TPA: aspartyl protease family protein [Caulobacteraceae bacterium]|jgi:tetratricopeptide (TPR) repeat protein/predicted aspartyl protease